MAYVPLVRYQQVATPPSHSRGFPRCRETNTYLERHAVWKPRVQFDSVVRAMLVPRAVPEQSPPVLATLPAFPAHIRVPVVIGARPLPTLLHHVCVDTCNGLVVYGGMEVGARCEGYYRCSVVFPAPFGDGVFTARSLRPNRRVYHVQTRGFVVLAMDTQGLRPEPAMYSAQAVVRQRYVLDYGGMVVHQGADRMEVSMCGSHLVVYDAVQGRFSQLTLCDPAGKRVPGRMGHTMVVSPAPEQTYVEGVVLAHDVTPHVSTVYVYGGFELVQGRFEPCSRPGVITVRGWCKGNRAIQFVAAEYRAVPGFAPPPRGFHASVLVPGGAPPTSPFAGHALLVHGGTTAHGTSGELWRYDFVSWTCVATTTFGITPQGQVDHGVSLPVVFRRTLHTIWRVDNTVFFIGGMDSGTAGRPGEQHRLDLTLLMARLPMLFDSRQAAGSNAHVFAERLPALLLATYAYGFTKYVCAFGLEEVEADPGPPRNVEAVDLRLQIVGATWCPTSHNVVLVGGAMVHPGALTVLLVPDALHMLGGVCEMELPETAAVTKGIAD